MAQALVLQEVTEGMAFIGGSIVAHDALDPDAVASEEGECILEESVCAFLGLVRHDFGIGETGGVIDGDMQRFPANAALAALAVPVAGDAMADAVDLTELL